MFIANLCAKCCGIGVLLAPGGGVTLVSLMALISAGLRSKCAGSFIEPDSALEWYTFGLASCASVLLGGKLWSTCGAVIAASCGFLACGARDGDVKVGTHGYGSMERFKATPRLWSWI